MTSSATTMFLLLSLGLLDTTLVSVLIGSLIGANANVQQELSDVVGLFLVLIRPAVLLYLWVFVLGRDQRRPRTSRSSAIRKHSSSNRKPVSFCNLPLEIRNMIYSCLFTGQDVTLRTDDRKQSVDLYKPRFVVPQIRRDRSLGLNILLVSKACSVDSKAILLNKANFHLEFDQIGPLMEDTLRGFSRDDLLRVRSLHCDHIPRWYSSLEYCQPLKFMTRLAEVDVLYALDMWFDVFDMNVWLDAFHVWPNEDPKEYIQANIIDILHGLASAWKPCSHKALLKHFKNQAARRRGMKLVFRFPIPIDGIPIDICAELMSETLWTEGTLGNEVSLLPERHVPGLLAIFEDV
ncbi:hypothetical protein LTR10_014508 [Elasticomyces elasticus]|uniref:F-box domain-containing protein n=1 Tax=Exophiala sideris TaxID=1016849 RepID=A0ABR0JT42_9EURO|nr:hypothetical protein LTR10_014508 [Elasticomyces elasticus]KAK5040487.1 hypothetical protein LTS07_000985 [Exophiala sideris]KAK5043087.1 hypothetical protein LTR13_000858 [Exophiala sideris]KAK5068865.1 hypothetical protein LTR69_000986 [Exophiala sideris]KAK5186461.1 hypothetical protein LTR44_001517 [Eurotiomycetes sp. CCFEE 6388]